jgi:CubicO group peptidase (beta-lactamase class C family)
MRLLEVGRVGAFVVLGGLLVASLRGDPWAAETPSERIAEIVGAEARLDLFSGTVVVAEQGRRLFAKGLGEANKEYGIPNGLKTRFNISSVQKSFIATVVLQLVQSGRIGLADPLTKYYPDCAYPTANQIQVRHLLNHSSGLGEYRDTDEYRLHSERFRTIDEVLPLLYRLNPAFAPGESHRYSNAGVLYLKGIIERVTKKRLARVLAERIFEPLGMKDTVLFVSGDLLQNRATGHELADDGERRVRAVGEPAAYAGGGIYSTGLDLLKFDQALYGDRLLDDEHKALMFTPAGPDGDAAFGWFVDRVAGTTRISHGGGSGGFATEFRRYPERRLTVIVNSNYGGGGFEMANAIEALLLGLPYRVASEVDLWHRKGMALQRAGKHRPAVTCFERNISTDEAFLPSLYQAARSRILGEYEQAEAVALLARYAGLADATTQPSVAAAWWRMGVAHEQLGDLAEAVTCYQKSLERDPAFSLAAESLERLNSRTKGDP